MPLSFATSWPLMSGQIIIVEWSMHTLLVLSMSADSQNEINQSQAGLNGRPKSPSCLSHWQTFASVSWPQNFSAVVQTMLSSPRTELVSFMVSLKVLFLVASMNLVWTLKTVTVTLWAACNLFFISMFILGNWDIVYHWNNLFVFADYICIWWLQQHWIQRV